MTTSFVRAAIVSLTALAACSELTGPKAELTDARERWEARRLRDYNYSFERSCFCHRDITLPVVIEVRAGVVNAVRYLETAEAVPPENVRFYPTVDELFDLIEEALDRSPARIDVDYDRSTGHPTRIDIDYSEQVADDEMWLRAWGLYEPRLRLQSSP